jgi:hypothetical protein
MLKTISFRDESSPASPTQGSRCAANLALWKHVGSGHGWDRCDVGEDRGKSGVIDGAREPLGRIKMLGRFRELWKKYIVCSEHETDESRPELSCRRSR